MPVDPLHDGFLQHFDKEVYIPQLNDALREIAVEHDCYFINLYPVFMNKQQRLRKEFTTDGLHLNSEGYRVWVDHLVNMGYLEIKK